MTFPALFPRTRLIGLLFTALTLTLPVAAKPVAFVFRVPAETKQDPFARELWAEVRLPNGHTRRLPAFSRGNDEFVVHARREFPGTYRLGLVTETLPRSPDASGVAGPPEVVERKHEPASPDAVEVRDVATLSPIARQGARLFSRAGHPFIPVGANVPWSRQGMEAAPYYRDAFARFGAQRLNWMRVWMAHWGRLNLDWLPAGKGFVEPGRIDATVASTWDELVELAEAHGVYVQLVLQHHGQYSTTVNSNWADNPWNASNAGGFLRTPRDFFTSVQARELTRRKYRYIVARWGYSPAILAWELFNEVHWVDPIQQERDVGVVSAWHAEMADALRAYDVYQHLVTTSTEDLASPIYARMDYYQPHLYPSDAIVGARQVRYSGLDRPVFYGEQGDDQLDLPVSVKKAGHAMVPPMWAGLFGASRMPAQPWLGHDILEQQRDVELGAVSRFIAETGLARHSDLISFSPAVEGGDRMPCVIAGCQVWQRGPNPEFTISLDGTQPVTLAEIPRMLSATAAAEQGFPSQVTYRLDLPRPVEAALVVPAVGSGEAGVAVRVGAEFVAAMTWRPGQPNPPARDQPQHVTFPLAAGPQTVEVRSTGRSAWVELAGLELRGLDAPVLGAAGLRAENLLAVWVWNRRDVYQPETRPARGTVSLESVPAGEWRITWWDTLKGEPGPSTRRRHPGGTMRLDTPAVARHAAVVLTPR